VTPPETTFPRDAEATKERLMIAAADEFSERGLAGARIDRIADKAHANKRMIYAYFGSKDDLFDAVLARHLGLLTEGVPFDAHDLPGYAGRLFDAIVADPQVLALSTWRNFERPEAGEAELASYKGKLDAIAAAQKAGRVDATLPPVDVLAALMALVTAWLNSAAALKQLSGADPLGSRRLKQHRKALVEIVRRMVTPSAR
jgi:AcrR family transcriptional regulator